MLLLLRRLLLLLICYHYGRSTNTSKSSDFSLLRLLFVGNVAARTFDSNSFAQLIVTTIANLLLLLFCDEYILFPLSQVGMICF